MVRGGKLASMAFPTGGSAWPWKMAWQGRHDEVMTVAVQAHESTGLVELYARMCLIRAFERRVSSLYRAAEIPGFIHTSLGQEAVAVGVCAALRHDDWIATTHRGHGHCIAKGADPLAMMAELFGRSTGTCRGKAGSLHIADISIGMLGANGVIGDGVTMAVGAAQAARVLGRDAVAVPFFGDGGINRGPVLESFNWAKAFELPVLFVCEDNRYSATTRTDEVTGGPGLAARAAGFGLHAITVDGNDVIAVREAAATLVGKMREGGGPALIHALTYRITGHVARDQAGYRRPGELARYAALDPITRCESWLLDHGVEQQRLDVVRSAVADLIARAVTEAEAAPWPEPHEVFTDSQDLGAPAWPS